MNQNKFIAYFDYLGFKQFIENNDHSYQVSEMDNIFRDIEGALAKGHRTRGEKAIIADLSLTKINAINFSDTIVFWTNDDSESSFDEILEIAYLFNSRTNTFFFPARGCICHGELEYIDYKNTNQFGSIYNINSVFGKGLVKAHEKAESQNWAGTVIDKSVIQFLELNGNNVDLKLQDYAKKYKVPYKKSGSDDEEYVLKLTSQFVNPIRIESMTDSIKTNFSRHNKKVTSERVQEILSNTLKYVESHLSQ